MSFLCRLCGKPAGLRRHKYAHTAQRGANGGEMECVGADNNPAKHGRHVRLGRRWRAFLQADGQRATQAHKLCHQHQTEQLELACGGKLSAIFRRRPQGIPKDYRHNTPRQQMAGDDSGNVCQRFILPTFRWRLPVNGHSGSRNAGGILSENHYA